MKTLLTICARGGSKGIPGKNIKPLNGIPLIAYTIRTALAFAERNNSDLALSTDDDKIKAVASDYGLKTDYKRPAALSTDRAGKIDAIMDLLEHQEKIKGCNYEYIIDMDVTSPLRTIGDMEHALSLIKKDPEALNIFSVSPASRNPYFNMVERKEENYVKLVKSKGIFKSRQEVPKVYDMNASFYIFRRKFFEEGHEVSITDRTLAYVVPHLCFDIDEPHDFTIMEIMLRQNLLDFEL